MLGADRAELNTEVAEPALDDVRTEDRGLVKDVIAMLEAMQQPSLLCKGWSVKPGVSPAGAHFYEVSAFIQAKNGEWEVFSDDLDLLRSVDYLRVGPVSVKVTGASAQIRARVLSRAERVMITESDIIRVRKRSRWF